MKQEVLVCKKNGLIYSLDKDFLVGLTVFKFSAETEFPAEGVKVYYDLDDMNAMPFRLYQRPGGSFYIK